jgi:hypothetical protein
VAIVYITTTKNACEQTQALVRLLAGNRLKRRTSSGVWKSVQARIAGLILGLLVETQPYTNKTASLGNY